MPFLSGTAQEYTDLLRRLRQFVVGDPLVTNIAFTGTPTGKNLNLIFDTKTGAPAETWTLTYVSASSWFTVTGSVSGAQANIPINTDYSNTLFYCRAVPGGTAYANGDIFTVTVGANSIPAADKWTQLEWTPYAAPLQLLIRGPGISGTQQIFGGITTEDNGANQKHWRVGGFTAYTASIPLASQPNVSSLPYVTLWPNSIPFWFYVNGDRIIVVANVSGTFHSMYLGYILPYATPAEWPYPHFVGGDSKSSLAYNDTTNDHHAYLIPAGGAHLRDTFGNWLQFGMFGTPGTLTDYKIWPYLSAPDQTLTILDNMEPLPSDGTYPLFPIHLVYRPNSGTPFGAATGQVLGAFNGVYAIPGLSVTAGSTTITVGGDTYDVFNDIFRTDRGSYYAVKR